MTMLISLKYMPLAVKVSSRKKSYFGHILVSIAKNRVEHKG